MGFFDNVNFNLADAAKFLTQNKEVLVTGASFAAVLFTLYRQSAALDVSQDIQKLEELSKKFSNAKSRMLAGKQYEEDDNLLGMKQAARNVCNAFNLETDDTKRNYLLTKLLGEVGEGCDVESPFAVEFGHHITLGNNVKIHCNVVLSDAAAIHIGDNVKISPGVTLSSQTYPYEALHRRDRKFAKKIEIGNDVWIGAGAVILPGVKIGDNVIVAANATVTADVVSDCVVAGVPARHVSSMSKIPGAKHGVALNDALVDEQFQERITN